MEILMAGREKEILFQDLSPGRLLTRKMVEGDKGSEKVAKNDDVEEIAPRWNKNK